MKILVTGGAGFIGSHLVDRLVESRMGEVCVLDNFSRGKMEHLAQCAGQVRIVHGDIRDRKLLGEVMNGVNLVYHLAAQSNVLGAVRDPDYSFETNVVGTYEVMRAAAAAGARRLIFSSSREVYGEPATLPVSETAPLAPKNAYGISKACAEMYRPLFADMGLETIVFRLANVYGERDSGRVIPLFIKQALCGETLKIFGGGKLLDFLWIDDLVDVLCQASQGECPDGPVNIGSGKGISLVDLAKKASSLTGNRSKVSIEEERQPEVGRFVADVTLARRLYRLNCPDDPIEHLASMVEHASREIPAKHN